MNSNVSQRKKNAGIDPNAGMRRLADDRVKWKTLYTDLIPIKKKKLIYFFSVLITP